MNSTEYSPDTKLIIFSNVNSLISRIRSSTDLSSVIEHSDEFLSVVGKASTIVGVTREISILYNRLRFEQFLVHLFYKLHEKENLDLDDEKKLNDFLKKDRNLKFVAEAIDACNHTRSIKCSAILGFFVGGIIAGDKKIGYSDYVLINALRGLFDEDLENFRLLYHYLQTHPDLYKNSNLIITVSKTLESYKDCPTPQFEMEMTVEKMKNNQIIGYYKGGALIGGGDAWGHFIFNKNSDYFYNILIKFETDRKNLG